jgi:enamine deaminase RidA (YjgF/YER057c/UK114 family)
MFWQGAGKEWNREVLVEDERGRGFPAVVRYGPYLFVSGADGHRRLSDEQIDPDLADNAVEQCRNSYGRVARRLREAGYGDDCAVWIENFTSGQHWRLERMALWPEYFGEENHMRAVSFGAQTRMHGINMLTSVVLAIDPAVPRHVAVPPPHRGRAARITRVGPFVFVIGVRGYTDPVSGASIPEWTATSLAAQTSTSIKALDEHLSQDGTPRDNFVRVDTALRAARFVPEFERALREYFGGKMPFAGSAVGTPLGSRGELEIGGIAVAPGEHKHVVWSPADPTRADSTRAAGLTFVRNVSGLKDETTGSVLPQLYGNLPAQLRQAVKNVEALSVAAGSNPEGLLRFDVVLRDIYAEDEAVAELKRLLGSRLPAMSFLGGEPQHAAEVEITAIVAAPTG